MVFIVNEVLLKQVESTPMGDLASIKQVYQFLLVHVSETICQKW